MRTGEVGDVAAHRVLKAKPQAVRAAAQARPDDPFGLRGALSKPAREFDGALVRHTARIARFLWRGESLSGAPLSLTLSPRPWGEGDFDGMLVLAA